MDKPKQKKRRPLHYFDEIYMMNFYFHIGWPKEEFKEYAVKHYNLDRSSELRGGCCLGLHSENAQGQVIWINNHDNKNESITLLAHECLHATINTLRDVGIRLDESSEESFTYYLQNLMLKAINLL